MLKGNHPNKYHQMLPHYQSVYEAKLNNINFESAREILMKEDYKMIVKRRFEEINIMMERKSFIKNGNISENKEMFIYGFKHFKTDKTDNCILFGCKSDELYENDIGFNFSSN